MADEYKIKQSNNRYPVVKGDGENWAVAITDVDGNVKSLLVPNGRTQEAAQKLADHLERETEMKIAPSGTWKFNP
ncbi:hypothetical protein AFCDBAGC_1837 [Methylobacterium cerastii]|uniref:DUF2188 domain-containing protein n=1 Tax=Methylobacterium cerastii TaxID=932741 RepID=A0ABQ4QGK4_9HYPH|nr:hypothetical protein [Methylobacterium cerastii]GJD43975.1 hypothetical protein AFCDBAGC_1837 [Methylobacterium cerastii]